MILNPDRVAPQVNHVRESNKRHEENEANISKLCDAVSGIAKQLEIEGNRTRGELLQKKVRTSQSTQEY